MNFSIASLPKNVKGVILATKIKYGSEETWFELFERAKKTQSTDERLSYIVALISTNNINLLKL